MTSSESLSNLSLEQKTALPAGEDYEFWEDSKEAIEYLKGVREEARTVRTSIGREEVEPDSQSAEDVRFFDEFRNILEYSASQKICDIRSDSDYWGKQREIVEYINSLRDRVYELTELLQTIEIVTKSNWDDIVNSDQTPCVAVGKWNSSNWCSLLEYFSNRIQKRQEELALDTKMLNWILLALVSIHPLDSYNQDVSHNMQVIKRYLESTNFVSVRDSDYFRIESIVITIKYIFNQQ
ncbi:hypothetical protein FG386_000669 [Cryptosporidium ryanae]|uniref:uncharacterized protein n=1 Tax=Cryptosporidium ryanae TaxID=515981 RepID=UPI00351A53C2|nr:hypothetical protein FG386_000669 [Cryptosporidium ryanae]